MKEIYKTLNKYLEDRYCDHCEDYLSGKDAYICGESFICEECLQPIWNEKLRGYIHKDQTYDIYDKIQISDKGKILRIYAGEYYKKGDKVEFIITNRDSVDDNDGIKAQGYVASYWEDSRLYEVISNGISYYMKYDNMKKVEEN